MKRSLIILFMALIALTLLVSFVWKSALWGLSAWNALSPLAAVVCAMVIVPQLFLKPRIEAFNRIPPVPMSVLRVCGVAAASVVIFWLLRSRHEFWGERTALRAAIETGTSPVVAPLATHVQRSLYRLMNSVFLTSPDSVITFFSIAAGALYVALAVRAAGLLSGADGENSGGPFALLILLSSGYVALFFGFGGNAQIAIVAALAFALEGMRFLREKRSLVPPAMLLLIAARSHLSAVYLVPSFIYLFGYGIRGFATRRRTVGEGVAFAVFMAAVATLEALIGRNQGAAHAAASPLREIFAPVSLSNIFNALLIIGPSSAVAAVFLVRNLRRQASRALPGTAPEELAFLGISAAAAFVAIIATSPLSEGGLGWQNIAATGPAFSMYALWALKYRFTEAACFKKIAAALVLVGAFHTLPLILVDAIPRAGEKRLQNLALAPGRAEMIIADAALGSGDPEKARTWYLASLERNKANELASERLGRIAMKREEYAEAISHFLDAHELKPGEPRYRLELAEALIEKRWFPEAIAHLETLTAAYPDSVSFWRRLGFARNNGNRYESAIVAYEKALALEPGSEENRRNLTSALLNRGAELQSAKKYDDALALYERAIELYPQDWRALNNISIIEMNRGHLQEAYDNLEEALKLFPFESSLHLNMGLVLEKLGKDREALEHMLKARDLDPIYSTAPMHIERLDEKLRVRNQVQRDSQRSPLNSP